MRFAQLDRYHGTFRSCNRAFHQDPSRRLDRWCGRCDKCCFVDLVLAPFMDRAASASVFAGDEPLENPANEERFRSLLELGTEAKPFECVGDTEECRSAALVGGAAGGPGPQRAAPPAVRRVGRCHSHARGSRSRHSSRRGDPTGFRIAMRQPISWSALADPSVGVGVWGLGVEGRASVRRLGAMGKVPVLVDDAPASPALDGLEVLATGSGGLDAPAPLRRRREEPGHQPRPTRGGPARGGGGGRVRWSGPVHGAGGPDPRRLHHRHQGQEHHDRAGRAPLERARLPRPCRAGTSGSHPGTPCPSPNPTTGSWRPRASRSPTCSTGPAWSR